MDTFNFAIIFYMTSEFIFIFPYGGTGCWWLFLVIFLKILFNALLKRYVALQNTLLISHHFELFFIGNYWKENLFAFFTGYLLCILSSKKDNSISFLFVCKIKQKILIQFSGSFKWTLSPFIIFIFISNP